MQPETNSLSPPPDWDRGGLPGWTYFSTELLARMVQLVLGEQL